MLLALLVFEMLQFANYEIFWSDFQTLCEWRRKEEILTDNKNGKFLMKR